MLWFFKLRWWVWLLTALNATAAEDRVIKVLPHFLDLQGRHALSPSLYDRDAYQAHLRKHQEERTAIRFDVQWRVKSTKAENLKLRLELRGSKASLPLTLEQTVKRNSNFSRWTAIKLEGDEYKNLGDVVAWRATLVDGEQPLAEQKSYLW